MVENMIARISKNTLNFTCTTVIQSMIGCLKKAGVIICLSLFKDVLGKFCALGRNRIVAHVPQPFRALQSRRRQVSLLRLMVVLC